MRNLSAIPWLSGFISASYEADINPLPTLRKMFPQYTWDFAEYQDGHNAQNSAPARAELETGGWEIIADSIGDDLPSAAYLVRTKWDDQHWCQTCDSKFAANGDCDCELD